MNNLPIIQKNYDLIKWYVPILNRLPKQHKFMLGERMISNLYDLLEDLIYARYATGSGVTERFGKVFHESCQYIAPQEKKLLG